MRELGSVELYDIANGSNFLAGGGGGSIKVDEDMIPEILRLTDTVTLKTIDEIKKEEWGAVLAAVGSTAAFHDVGLHGAASRATQLLESITQKTFAYTIPGEMSPAIFVAMLAAVQSDHKKFIVDADGAGRAVPKLDMNTFANTILVSPFVIANANNPEAGEKDQIELVLYAKSPNEIEKLVRPIVNTPNQFDQIAGFAGWTMNGEKMKTKNALIPGTVTLAENIGRALRNSKDNPIEALRKILKDRVYMLFPGDGLCEVTKIEDVTTGGFDRGVVTFRQGKIEINVINQNENLLAWNTKKDHPVAMAPDLICYLTPEGKALSNPDISEGDKLYLIGLIADNRLREAPLSKAFMSVLNTMGYYGPYVPIEKLLSH